MASSRVAPSPRSGVSSLDLDPPVSRSPTVAVRLAGSFGTACMGILVDARMIFAQANSARYEALWHKLLSGEVILDSSFDAILVREPGLADYLRAKIAGAWDIVNAEKYRRMIAEDDGA